MTENPINTFIFNRLHLQPRQTFTIKDQYGQRYFLTPDGTLYQDMKPDRPALEGRCYLLARILGDPSMVQGIPFMPDPTPLQRALMETIKGLGYNFLARDQDGQLFMYEDKPRKGDFRWYMTTSHPFGYLPSTHSAMIGNLVNWSDKRPFYIKECP